MLRKFERFLIGVAIVLALLIAKAIYQESRSEQCFQRAMGLMQNP